jgi:hypothetical protein
VVHFAFAECQRFRIVRSDARQNRGNLDDPHGRHKPRDPFACVSFVMGQLRLEEFVPEPPIKGSREQIETELSTRVRGE